jgi:hypothetical protein
MRASRTECATLRKRDVLRRRYLRAVSIWAPVAAALGSSLLTGGLGFGGLWWQQRHRDQVADRVEKGESYHQMVAQSLPFTIRASALRITMRTRSGLGEGVDVFLRLRRPSDPMELHDWLAQGFEPINLAWSKIQMIGSAEAVAAANKLLDACADVVTVATEFGRARGRVASTLAGLRWTPEQDGRSGHSRGPRTRRVHRRRAQRTRERPHRSASGRLGIVSPDNLRPHSDRVSDYRPRRWPRLDPRRS